MGLDLAIFKGSEGDPDRTFEWTDISFTIDEWGDFFFEDLHVTTLGYIEGEDMVKRHQDEKAMFQAALLDFPMLSRINDYYSDAEYNPKEVSQLLNECILVLPKLKKPLAITFANRLIAGCEEAIKSNSGLFLGAD